MQFYADSFDYEIEFEGNEKLYGRGGRWVDFIPHGEKYLLRDWKDRDQLVSLGKAQEIWSGLRQRGWIQNHWLMV